VLLGFRNFAILQKLVGGRSPKKERRGSDSPCLLLIYLPRFLAQDVVSTGLISSDFNAFVYVMSVFDCRFQLLMCDVLDGFSRYLHVIALSCLLMTNLYIGSYCDMIGCDAV
jgi:hypothetical protein